MQARLEFMMFPVQLKTLSERETGGWNFLLAKLDKSLYQ